MRSRLTEPLLELAEAWQGATAVARRRWTAVVLGLVWFLALLLARQGTFRARSGAALLIAGSLGVVLVWRVLTRRRLRRPEWVAKWVGRRSDPERADRVVRALSLLRPDGEVRADDGTSSELARMHVSRAIEQLVSTRIVERAGRSAARVGRVAFVAGACLLGLALSQTWAVLEGADVLLARGGQAPVGIRWLDEVEVAARPPDYLREPERRGTLFAGLALPYGTQVAVRGAPLHAGRRLSLSDGTTEVPFVEDGSGAVVARLTVTQSASLCVVARFGDVVIADPDSLFVESIPDRAPTVILEGAPRTIALVDETEDVVVAYDATDDHGLREVDLVLRSGTREERRVLSKLDGDTPSDRGGYSLKLRDPFLKKSHAPIEVVVEAKDNDPLTGPKWGASRAITLVPPDVGEQEARRLEALRALRDALVDSLAWGIRAVPPLELAGRASLAAEGRRRVAADGDALGQAISRAYGGVRVPLRIRTALASQLEKTRAAADSDVRAPSAASHAAVVAATRRFVLVLDAVVRGLGMRDAHDSARSLAEVADDLAAGASQMREEAPPGADGARARTRMDAAASVLSGGGKAIGRLGSLGRDLGEIIEADLLRVGRARAAGDWPHTELAAQDLAARLRQPDPSFGGARGGVGRAGGESGGAPGASAGQNPTDDVDQAFEEAAREVEQLAQDHAGEVSKVEQALAGATSQEELEELRQEARRHADAVRRASQNLPSVGNGSDSWTSKGASARELAEQMARSLEDLRGDDALESGRSALGALDEGKKILQKGGWMEDPSGRELRRVEDARKKLEAELRWAEDALAQARRRAADRARSQLAQGGEEEGKLAERARDVAGRGRERGSLPEQAAASIDEAERAARQAADALKQGDADGAVLHQREAQRNFEAANDQLRGDDDDGNGSAQPGREDAPEGRAGRARVQVPNAADHRGPEEFRKRVVGGLGQPASGTLRDAVRRYAEGLLR